MNKAKLFLGNIPKEESMPALTWLKGAVLVVTRAYVLIVSLLGLTTRSMIKIAIAYSMYC